MEMFLELVKFLGLGLVCSSIKMVAEDAGGDGEESSDENPAGQGDDLVNDDDVVDGRPVKNWKAEIERKNEKLAKLEKNQAALQAKLELAVQNMSNTSTSQKTQDMYDDVLSLTKEHDVDPDFLKKLTVAIEKRQEAKTQSMIQQALAQSESADVKMNESFKEVAEIDDSFKLYVSNLGKEAREVIKSKYPSNRDYWGNQDLIRWTLLELANKKGMLKVGSEKKESSLVNDSKSDTSLSKAGNGVPANEIERYAVSKGLAFKTKEDRQRVANIYKNIKSVDEMVAKTKYKKKEVK